MQLEIIERTPASRTHPTPILCVHGMWHAAWCWDEHFLPYFADHGYAAYAVSLRGHGGSAGHERLRWHSLADYLADLDQAVQQMDRPPILIGHSLGGLLARRYLARHTLPAAVLLAAVPSHGALPATWRVFRRHPLRVLHASLTLNLLRLVDHPAVVRDLFYSAALPEDRLQAYAARVQNESFRAFVEMLAPAWRRPRLTTPLLALGAANDALIAPSEVAATARTGGVTVGMFPDMAHSMILEPDWRAVADRILAWLAARGL